MLGYDITRAFLIFGFRTSGVAFKPTSISVSVPATSRAHTVRLSGTVLEAGMLNVLGCRVKMLGGCIEEEISPMNCNINSKDGGRHRQTDKEKLYGDFQLQLSASKNNKKEYSASKVKQQADNSHLELTVLPEQPLLQTSTELTESQTALMLFEGEKYVLSLLKGPERSFNHIYLEYLLMWKLKMSGTK